MTKCHWKVTQFFPEALSLSTAEPNLLIVIGVGVEVEVTGDVDIQNIIVDNESADR
jgi:hypothetical protein